MKQTIKSKILWLCFILFAMGTAFGYIENTYYQYIDEKGALVESWFMPLSLLCIFLGGIGLFFVVVKTIWLATNKKA
jgi:predicted PurR-regulated permease PerM